MNLLLVLPPQQPKSGGNITYSNRIKKGLSPRGIHLNILSLDRVEPYHYEQADIVHVFNAFRTGRFVLPTVQRLRKPMILTITGTDINEYMTKAETREETYNVVEYASRIIQLTHSSRQQLIDLVPSAAAKSIVVNLGVDLPAVNEKTRRDFGLNEQDFIFLLPAGIRPVKDPLAAFEPLRRVHERFPATRFVVAGPAMEQNLFADFMEKANSVDWVTYLGEVDHADMPALLLSANVVLNTSKSEGLSHALLEGMSLGKPVLASRVPGNIDLVTDGSNGFLFDNEDEFVEKAVRYIEDSQLRQQLAVTGQQWVQEHYSVQREIDTFQQIYNDVMLESYRVKPE